MKIDELSTSNYMKEGDVTPELTVTIASEKSKDMAKDGQKPDVKCILGFSDHQKELVCNKTNFKTISKNTGQGDSKNWIGQKITVWFNPNIEYGGEVTGGIRVRPSVAATPPPNNFMPEHPVSEDEKPF